MKNLLVFLLLAFTSTAFAAPVWQVLTGATTSAILWEVDTNSIKHVEFSGRKGIISVTGRQKLASPDRVQGKQYNIRDITLFIDCGVDEYSIGNPQFYNDAVLIFKNGIVDPEYTPIPPNSAISEVETLVCRSL